MKIYVDNYDMYKMKWFLPTLEKLRISTRNVVKLYSPASGVYLIEKNNAYKLREESTPDDASSATHDYQGFSLVLQNTKLIKEEIISQLPVHCLWQPETTFVYSINPNKGDAKVLMYIEGSYEKAATSTDNKEKDKHNLNGFAPSNFYFETNNDCKGANNQQFQNELNGFLSLLK